MNRRTFIAGAAAAALAQHAARARPSRRPRFAAIAFDAFPILDPRPVFALAETLFPGKGTELSTLWKTRQFEYQWLRALSRRYADFLATTEDALVFAARQLQLPLTSGKREQLMHAYLELKAWPDAVPALRALKADGIRLAFLSNMTRQMLDAGIANSGLEGTFEHVLSTDTIRTYKPDPGAYQMAPDAFGLARDEILFAAFAAWDAAGAKSFGFTTYWVNRSNSAAEELGNAADAQGHDLSELRNFVSSG
jgi:2-haloacid dehalogenase